MFVTLTSPTDPTTRAVYHTILRTFAQTGNPPSLETLISAMNLPDASTGEHYLTEIEVGGCISLAAIPRQILSAYPFSAVSTAHRVTVGDLEVYAMRAIDALGMPFMLD